jgi:hypothetical protein
MTERSGGYQAERAGLLRRARAFADERDRMAAECAALEEVFLREGRPLGDDQYGAELERNLPKLKESVFGGFRAYIDELEGVRKGLIANADGYRAAEQAGTVPGE